MVKNEARYVWFSVMSVINHVGQVLLWDTGSTDGTQEIIDEILKTPEGRKKVYFREYGNVTPDTFEQVRQAMLDATKTDWFLMVDGDEVWWQDSIRHLVSVVNEKGDNVESIVVPTVNLVGDIYHYQDQSGGNYRIDDKKGHYNIRAVKRTIPGLHLEKPHGQQGFYDKDDVLIQERNKKGRKFLDFPYLHFTNMRRSSSRSFDISVPKRDKKLKYEIGMRFPENFAYPEVFYGDRPEIVSSPWEKMPFVYQMRAILETPFKRIKRKLVPSKPGY